MRRNLIALVVLFVILLPFILFSRNSSLGEEKNIPTNPSEGYWFVLHRKSNREELFKGIPGNKEKSNIVRTFTVKTGIPEERPTPLPKLLGKEYWVITQKQAEPDNPETAPYFLTLNIPAPSEEPYGPMPYEECNGQCHWRLPGAFGLHGTAGNPAKLATDDPGSSGCIRHRDEDITYLYNLLDPKKEEVRYYVEDN